MDKEGVSLAANTADTEYLWKPATMYLQSFMPQHN